jgi:hypothetical protein
MHRRRPGLGRANHCVLAADDWRTAGRSWSQHDRAGGLGLWRRPMTTVKPTIAVILAQTVGAAYNRHDFRDYTARASTKV